MDDDAYTTDWLYTHQSASPSSKNNRNKTNSLALTPIAAPNLSVASVWPLVRHPHADGSVFHADELDQLCATLSKAFAENDIERFRGVDKDANSTEEDGLTCHVLSAATSSGYSLALQHILDLCADIRAAKLSFRSSAEFLAVLDAVYSLSGDIRAFAQALSCVDESLWSVLVLHYLVFRHAKRAMRVREQEEILDYIRFYAQTRQDQDESDSYTSSTARVLYIREVNDTSEDDIWGGNSTPGLASPISPLSPHKSTFKTSSPFKSMTSSLLSPAPASTAATSLPALHWLLTPMPTPSPQVFLVTLTASAMEYTDIALIDASSITAANGAADVQMGVPSAKALKAKSTRKTGKKSCRRSIDSDAAQEGDMLAYLHNIASEQQMKRRTTVWHDADSSSDSDEVEDEDDDSFDELSSPTAQKQSWEQVDRRSLALALENLQTSVVTRDNASLAPAFSPDNSLTVLLGNHIQAGNVLSRFPASSIRAAIANAVASEESLCEQRWRALEVEDEHMRVPLFVPSQATMPARTSEDDENDSEADVRDRAPTKRVTFLDAIAEDDEQGGFSEIAQIAIPVVKARPTYDKPLSVHHAAITQDGVISAVTGQHHRGGGWTSLNALNLLRMMQISQVSDADAPATVTNSAASPLTRADLSTPNGVEEGVARSANRDSTLLDVDVLADMAPSWSRDVVEYAPSVESTIDAASAVRRAFERGRRGKSMGW